MHVDPNLNLSFMGYVEGCNFSVWEGPSYCNDLASSFPLFFHNLWTFLFADNNNLQPNQAVTAFPIGQTQWHNLTTTDPLSKTHQQFIMIIIHNISETSSSQSGLFYVINQLATDINS